MTTVACRLAGFSPRVGQEAPRITSMVSLVATGMGISLVPSSLQQLNMDGVVYRRLKGPVQPKAIVNLASRRGDPSAAVQNFVSLVRSEKPQSPPRTCAQDKKWIFLRRLENVAEVQYH